MHIVRGKTIFNSGDIMRYTIYLFSSILLIIHVSMSSLTGLDADAIIEKSDKALRGETQRSSIIITVHTRRWTRSMEMNSFMITRGKKSFGEVISPARDAGNRFLLIDKNMWQYVPRLQQTIKIAPSMMLQSWMGSDFTNDDIVKESSIIEDYTKKLLGTETVEGHRCYRIELTPKPDAAVVWGKIIYFARESDCLPVREEFYNEHGVMKKLMSCTGFKTMHDRTIPTVYTMRTIGKEDQYTRMEIKSIRFNEPIPERTFSMSNLQRK